MCRRSSNNKISNAGTRMPQQIWHYTGQEFPRVMAPVTTTTMRATAMQVTPAMKAPGAGVFGSMMVTILATSTGQGQGQAHGRS